MKSENAYEAIGEVSELVDVLLKCERIQHPTLRTQVIRILEASIELKVKEFDSLYPSDIELQSVDDQVELALSAKKLRLRHVLLTDEEILAQIAEYDHFSDEISEYPEE